MAEDTEFMYKKTLEYLNDRGIDIYDLGELVKDLQIKHSPNIDIYEAMENIYAVLRKREVQHAILTGLELDRLAEEGHLSEPLLDIIKRDEGLYGVDETLAASIFNCYGSIAISNFGYLDITKPGVIGSLNDIQEKNNEVHTFADDIVAGIVAAACSRYAHQEKKTLI